MRPEWQGRSEGRLVSIDVFRGLTVAGMILVTDPGTYSAVYPQLLHAPWNGATATDMIFPSFLFLTGVAMTLAFAARVTRGSGRSELFWHVTRRSGILLALGLLVNGFPQYEWRALRLPGVLQRIALCYLFGASLYLLTTRTGGEERAASRRQWVLLGGITAGLLVIYWMLLKLVPVPGFGAGGLDSMGSLPAYLDRAIFGTGHMWAYGVTPGQGVTYDPEGLLSTVPATANVLMGVLAGMWLRTTTSRERKAAAFLAAGAVLVLLGWQLRTFLPINKRLWTPPFALVSGGVSLVLLAVFYWAVDIARWRSWAVPALVFGTNAILAYVVSSLLTTTLDTLQVGGLSAHRWVFEHVFAPFLQPVHASLAYAVSVVLLNLLLLLPLYHRRIFVRV